MLEHYGFVVQSRTGRLLRARKGSAANYEIICPTRTPDGNQSGRESQHPPGEGGSPPGDTKMSLVTKTGRSPPPASSLARSATAKPVLITVICGSTTQAWAAGTLQIPFLSVARTHNRSIATHMWR